MRLVACLVSFAIVVAGCATDDREAIDASLPRDAGTADGGGQAMDGAPADASDDAASDPADGGAIDGEVIDAGAVDGGGGETDGGVLDAGGIDAGHDAGTPDAGLDAGGIDAGRDAGPPDAGLDAGGIDAGRDAGTPDAGLDAGGIDAGHDAGMPDAGRDAGAGDCISGATGTHALRFRWAGSGAGSTAYVVYERNQLPDTSRWRVTSASSSIGYTPRFDDVFLGEGGLDLGGTAFIDVELSTMGLASISNITIAVYGRSFNTTASGSFRWQTFDGTGASPASSLANSAPYEWYPADATTEISAGDDGILLRIRPGPASNRIVVNRVELCFDAR